MRPIKYRCFNKKTNTMENNIYSINLAHNEVVIWKEIYDDGQSYVNYETLFSSKDEFELMQFTGLHDRNGKEIYEGDILQGYEWNDDYSSRSIPSYKYNISYKLVTSCGCCSPIHGWKINDVMIEEVIGNIYENPELLESKNEI